MIMCVCVNRHDNGKLKRRNEQSEEINEKTN